MINTKTPTIRTAVIDVGTLKSKFEVREFDQKFNHQLIHKEKQLTVLGRNLDKSNGMIIDRAVTDTIQALHGFKQQMTELHVNKHRAVTTEAIRKAKNASQVLAQIADETGIVLQILDHQTEADLYFHAVAKDFPSQVIAVADIGGGSVQVVIGKDDRIYETHLFNTGAYVLQEFTQTHHPTNAELTQVKKYVNNQLQQLAISAHRPVLLVYGSTNIIDFMQAMSIKLDETGQGDHRFSTTAELLPPVYAEIVKYPYEERMKMYPAEPYYMWSAENALINVLQICEYLQISRIYPSNNNISSGILHQLAQEAWQQS